MIQTEKEIMRLTHRQSGILTGFVVFFLAILTVFFPYSNAQDTMTISDTQRDSFAGKSEMEANRADFETKIKLPAEFHPWGAFERGAWCLSRTVIEGHRRGRMTPKTFIETSIVLHEKNEQLFTTVTETFLLLAGKTIQKEPRPVTTDLWGIMSGETTIFTELASQDLQIEGMLIRCNVVKISSESQDVQREIKFWVNEKNAPYLFKKECSVFQKSNGQCLEKTVQRVTSLNLQLCVQGKVLKGYQYSQVSHFPTYISKSETIASLSVPGRIVTQITHETDLRGRPLQDISTELLDFGLNDSERQRGIYQNSMRVNRLIVDDVEKPKKVEPETEKRPFVVTFSPNKTSDDTTEITDSTRNTNSSENTETKADTESETESVPISGILGLEEIGRGATWEKNEWISENEAYETENGDISTSMPRRFFFQFRTHWQLGKNLQSEDGNTAIGTIFPNIRFERWQGILERSLNVGEEPANISPLYNETLRMNRQNSAHQSGKEKPMQTISTQSLREMYDAKEYDAEEEENIGEIQEIDTSMNGANSEDNTKNNTEGTLRETVDKHASKRENERFKESESPLKRTLRALIWRRLK